MPFGSGPLGSMPIGVDPPTFGPEYQRVAPPPAAYFDPRTGDFLQDEAGRILDMGTTEQQVALSFAIQRRSLAHDRTVGHDFLDMPRVHGEKLKAEIRRRARLASPFDALLASGRVELLGVESEHPKDTESRMLIRWKLAGDNQERTAAVGTR